MGGWPAFILNLGAAGGDTPPPPGTPADLVAALKSRFEGWPGLEGLTGVFNRKATPRQAFPFLVVNVVGEDPVLTLSRTGHPAWAEVQFSVLDSDDVRGLGLRDAAYRSLAPNVTPDLAFDDGTDSGRFPGKKWEAEQPGRAPGGASVWQFGFAYQFYVGRAW